MAATAATTTTIIAIPAISAVLITGFVMVTVDTAVVVTVLVTVLVTVEVTVEVVVVVVVVVVVTGVVVVIVGIGRHIILCGGHMICALTMLARLSIITPITTSIILLIHAIAYRLG